jgi:glycosyltransferase involved in cell wall biosynthesis
MKILHVITSLKLGGAETMLCNLLSIMTQNTSNEHRVAYFYYGPNVEKIKKLGIKTYNLSGRLFKYDSGYKKLKNIVRDFSPDIIHSSLWSANIFSRLISKKYNIPLINDLHLEAQFAGKFRNYIEYKTMNTPDVFIAVSDGIKNAYLNKISDEKLKSKISEKITVIKNGINIDLLKKNALNNPITRKELKLNEKDFVIGSIGRMEKIKSYDLLIKSFAEIIKSKKYDFVKLCLVGDGSELTNLKNLAKDLNIFDKVLFIGAMDDAQKFYPIFDCFAISSKVEGISMSILEALSFGLGIITTHKSIEHEVIKHKINGFIVTDYSPESYSKGIDYILNNRGNLENMKRVNTELVEKNFNIFDIVKKYEKIYENIYKKVLAK